MDFGHDTIAALGTAVELVNSSPDLGGEGVDGIGDLAELRAFVAAEEISGLGRLVHDDVPAIHRLRSRFHQVWLAPDLERSINLVNSIVAGARTTPRLTNHDGYDWHVHYFAEGASVAEHLAADSGMALAFVLAAGERERLRVCENPGCAHVFVDLSRNRCRRYCDSKTCGNRLHVAAYRARKAAAG